MKAESDRLMGSGTLEGRPHIHIYCVDPSDIEFALDVRTVSDGNIEHETGAEVQQLKCARSSRGPS